MSTLAVIPARGGSKGVPGKNIRMVGGKPLIAWTIDVAHKCSSISQVICTTDDAEIAETARQYGCDVPFLRPPELSGDTASSIDVVLHALSRVASSFERVVLLQPTSPLRECVDVEECIRLQSLDNRRPVVSVTEVDLHPAYTFFRAPDGRLDAVLPEVIYHHPRRQDLKAAFRLNGAVYVASPDFLRINPTFLTPDTVGYVMPKDRSLEIDTISELDEADRILSMRAASSDTMLK